MPWVVAMSEKDDARAVQRYTGAAYTTCLRWVRTLRAERLIDTTVATTREAAVRVALHKRFPDVAFATEEAP